MDRHSNPVDCRWFLQPEAVRTARKDGPHMGLALSKQQVLLLLVVALLTILVISAVIFSTVAHFNTLHWATSWLSPDFKYGGY